MVGHMCPLHLEILVVEGKLLGFDLLQGFDTIKNLTELGEANFLAENLHRCATIKIDEPDSSAPFNQWKNKWTTSWKWAGGQMPDQLKNRILGVPCVQAYSDQIRKGAGVMAGKCLVGAIPRKKLGSANTLNFINCYNPNKQEQSATSHRFQGV